MKTNVVLWVILLLSNPVWADATLNYELQGPNGEKKDIQISIIGEMVRIDGISAEDSILLFQAGHLFPLFQMNHSERNYRRLTPEFKAYLQVEENREPNKDLFSYPEITLKPVRKQQVVAGIKCRLVHELLDNKPVIEHCLANSARAGLSERETRSLIRTYAILRKYRDVSWPGTGTVDEKYVSVRSRHLNGGESLALKSVSAEILDPAYLRIPRNYKLVAGNEE